MTTVKELSELLGVSKSTIMAYCKEELGIKPEPRKALQLDDAQSAAICSRFGDCITAEQPAEHQERAQLPNSAVLESAELKRPSADDYAALQIENARLQERVNGLERENALLRERIQAADAALEREQHRAAGFWSRLGQRLLGDGSSGKEK